MPRRRLGVVVLLDAPLAQEVDGIRRALGDPALARIAAHVTLVPPVNVRSEMLDAVVAQVRTAAGACSGPLALTFGPPQTFLPVNPVVYLAVGGDLPGLRSLRDHVFVAPLARELTWPWMPHVTLADGLPEDRIAPAVRTLRHFSAAQDIDRVVLLEEHRSGRERRWEPIADATLGPVAVVGRGGLEVTMQAARLLDPEALAMLREADPCPVRPGVDDPARGGAVVVTARVAGDLAGVARAWQDAEGSHLAVFVAPDHRHRGVGRHLLACIEDRLRSGGGGSGGDPRWDTRTLHGHGPAGFYLAHSNWTTPAPP